MIRADASPLCFTLAFVHHARRAFSVTLERGERPLPAESRKGSVMSLAVGIPVAISALKALLKYRARVDEILALKEATEAIPFSLPPAPFDFMSQRDAMFAFFHSEPGRLVLELRAQTDSFAKLEANPLAPANANLRSEFLQLFFEASDTAPIVLGPQSEARSVRASPEMRLSYYVVSSHRLSRNPTLTRLLLATADTLLEVAGENAGLFISNPKTEAIVSSLIREFAGKRDFDDDSAEMLLRGFLRSVVVAALENQSQITEEPALNALFAALSGMRDDFGDDFVARIITKRGFQTLVGKYLTAVGEDPEFLVEDGPFQEILSATLKDLGKNFETIFDDPKALFGVLEVALASAVHQAPELLGKRVRNKPLLSAVLQSVLAEVEARSDEHALVGSFANGDILAVLFHASMSAIAANPGALATAARIDELSAHLVAGVASVVATQQLSEVLSTQTLRDITSRSLSVLADNSSEWAGNSEFVVAVTTSVLRAAASALEDGLSKDDLASLLDAAIKTSTANLGMLKLDSRLELVLAAVGSQLSEFGVRASLTPSSRRDLIFATVEAVARNPRVWSQFGDADLVQPLVVAVIQGLATDKTALFTGPTWVSAVHAVLTALARGGQAFIDQEVTPDQVNKLLTTALRRLDQEVGLSVDADTVVEYLRRLVASFLANPFEPTNIAATRFKEIHEIAMGGMAVAEEEIA